MWVDLGDTWGWVLQDARYLDDELKFTNNNELTQLIESSNTITIETLDVSIPTVRNLNGSSIGVVDYLEWERYGFPLPTFLEKTTHIHEIYYRMSTLYPGFNGDESGIEMSMDIYSNGIQKFHSYMEDRDINIGSTPWCQVSVLTSGTMQDHISSTNRKYPELYNRRGVMLFVEYVEKYLND